MKPQPILIKSFFLVILSLLSIYILIHIFRRLKHRKVEHGKVEHGKVDNDHSHMSSHKMKCNSENCLDKYNYNKCPCHKNKTKELFTMAQSVFPLHDPTLPAFSQIVNENMANITDNYMEHTEAHPLTRDFPSQETSTGFFNVKGDASLIIHK